MRRYGGMKRRKEMMGQCLGVEGQCTADGEQPMGKTGSHADTRLYGACAESILSPSGTKTGSHADTRLYEACAESIL